MRARHRPKAAPSNDDTRDIVREFGDAWGSMAGQAMIWAFLIGEIPRQVYTHNCQVKAAHQGRIDELERHFPGDIEIANREKMVADGTLYPSISIPNGPVPSPVASIVRRLREFPRYEARVDFALGRDGDVAIQCVCVVGPALPAFIRSPKNMGEARERAHGLVRAAISTLTLDSSEADPTQRNE